MFRYWISLVAIVLCSSVVRGEDAPQDTLPTPGDKAIIDQASYGIGINIGSSIKTDDLDINVEALVAGIRDALSNVKPRMTEEQISAALDAFQKKMDAKAAAKGRAFLAANKAKPGVTTLPSGLQYTVIKQGNGPTPKLTDTVRTHYHGTFINGEVFDSSVQRNEPATFPVGRVIRAWTEALQLMPVGSKWRLFVPSELGYGPQGYPPNIGPNAVLIFDVELLGIE